MEEANEKRSGEKDQVSIRGPDTLLKRTPGGSSRSHSPGPTGNGLEGPGPNSNLWLYSAEACLAFKHALETALCYKRAGHKHTQVSSGVFFVVLVCAPDARAVLSSSSVATACFTEMAGPSLGRPGLWRSR